MTSGLSADHCLNAEVKPGEEKVISLAWNLLSEYADDGKETRPPIVEWVNAESFPCFSSGYCYGEFYQTRYLVRVAWRSRMTKFSETSLVHELCHARFPEDGGRHELCRNNLPPVSSINTRLQKMGY